MFIFVVSVVVTFLLFRHFVLQVRPPLLGIYTQATTLHALKTWVFRWVLNRRKQQNVKKVSVNEEGAGYGMRSRNKPEDMDRAQPLSKDHPKAVDAVYFNGGNKDGYYCVFATARRHNGLIQTLLYIRIPGLGMLQLPTLPETAHHTDKDLVYSAAGLNIDVIQPMKTWSIKYNGKLRLIKADNSSSEVDVNFDLLWSATTQMFDFDTDLDTNAMAEAIALEPWNKKFFKNLKESHQTHYEQFGRINGTVNVDSKANKINVTGVRDHSYGNIRDWSDLHRYAIQYIVMDDGRSFCIGNICLKSTMSRLIIGYVFHPDGRMDTVPWTDIHLHEIGEDGTDPDEWEFSFTTGPLTSPEMHRVKCHVQQRVVFYMGEDWEGRIHERMCNYTINGKSGYGISEWDYNYKGGRGNLFQR